MTVFTSHNVGSSALGISSPSASFCGLRPVHDQGWRMGPGRTPLRKTKLPANAVADRATALDTLGLPLRGTVTDRDIKRAFKKKVLATHPDKKGGDAHNFGMVMDAYRVLMKIPGHKRARSKRSHPEGADEEAFKDPSHWRWNQNTGFNPNDLDDVWADIGYNPYTGEYHRQRDVAGVDEAWTSPATDSYSAGYTASVSEEPQDNGPREPLFDNWTIVQICGYIVMIICIIMYAEFKVGGL